MKLFKFYVLIFGIAFLSAELFFAVHKEDWIRLIKSILFIAIGIACGSAIAQARILFLKEKND